MMSKIVIVIQMLDLTSDYQSVYELEHDIYTCSKQLMSQNFRLCDVIK
jgi:hypothetical protein